jgi:Dolichyl-phosphate-mannose-protein mannosyltransferase
LEGSGPVAEGQIEVSAGETRPGSIGSIEVRMQYAIYTLALAVSISIWFIAIRAPLWLDETISFWQINAGFSGISSRQGLSFPAYSYILWLSAVVLGKSEIALRIPQVLAMLGAVYLLYRAARELFERDVAIIAAVIFCLHPVVIFASIDVRPYAFAALAISSSIFALVCLRRNNSNWLAALFGLSAACIVYFQFLFVVILPALAICFLALKGSDRKTLRRQLGVALVAFVLAFLPVIPGLHYMFHTGGTHVFANAPTLVELAQTLAQRRIAFVLAVTIFIAAIRRRLDLQTHLEGWPVLLCASLALVPILILYGVSVGTSIHVFESRYRLIAVPGVALSWALVVSRINSRTLRLLFCVAAVAATAYHYLSSPTFKFHGYTWKYALEFVEKNASADDAPVLICSDLPEANYMPMPVGSAIKDSGIFAPLTYYKLSVPVVGLPRALNAEAIRIGSQFLQQAAQRHERFLALAYWPSYGTLEWMVRNAAGTHSAREVGVFDDIKVLEFIPRTQPDGSR